MTKPTKNTEVWLTVARPAEGASITFEMTLHIHRQIDGETKSIQIQEGGFAICVGNHIYAYRNHCPHVGSPLDWVPNQFFSNDGQELICHTHGARFNPINGNCIAGPCPRGLYPLPVQDHGGHICVPSQYTVAHF